MQLNSLANIEKTGEKLTDELYSQYDSIRMSLTDGEWFDRESEIEYEVTKIDSLLGKRINEIVQKQYGNKTGLMLTLGGNGSCGIGGKWYDNLTLKYGFKYKSILCSDIIFYEHNMAAMYNNYAKKHLDSINGKGWEQKLEDEILEKKRDVKIKTNFISVLKRREYHIYSKELLVFPKEVTKLKNLKILYITGNYFTEVDVSLANLKKMKRLYLYSNKLDNFPKVILELSQLEWLFLNNNQIEFIPENITTLNKLAKLDLSNNKLTDLPKSLSNMKSLKELDVTDNDFSEIPKVLYDMGFLEKLRIGCNKYEWKDNEKIQKQLSLLKKALPNTKIY